MDRLLHTADMDTDIKLYFGIVDSFDEKQNQAGFAFDSGFSKNISKMGAHGIIRDMQFLADQDVIEIQADKLGHLQLSRRKMPTSF